MKLEDCKVGQKVYFGRANGEQTLGEIVKVNGVKCKVKQLDQRGSSRSYPIGTIWGVPPSLMTPANGVSTPASTPAPAPKRTDAEILQDIQGVYNGLSPENLYCDGEVSHTWAQRTATRLRVRLRELERELGRRVSEAEAFGEAYCGFNEADRHSFRGPSAKETCPFKKGDKVRFEGKRGEEVVGYIRTINNRTVTVDPIGQTNGRYWRVSPGALKAA